MRTEDFAFELPEELIAQRPVQPRDAARLLWVGEGLQDKTVLDLAQILRPGDLLVLNDTQVIPARLFGKRGEAKIEVTLHQAADDATWRAFARPAKKLKAGDRLDFPAGLSAEVTEKGEAGEVTLRFPFGGERLLLALSRSGAIPLPPYIRKGRADERDSSDYQTLFAAKPGAVAAPTASLHFTPRLMESLKARGVDFAIVTLHVGAGTFLPVKVDDPRQHKMHGEWGEIGEATAEKINRTRQAGGRIVAVGTTALRLIEAAANEKGEVPPFSGEVKLFILPGYAFKVADLLMTNFHLPRSTLFMLVSAFAGVARMRKAYEHAIAKGYRFYSYGDSSLLERAR